VSYYFGGGNQAASFAIRYYETASGQCPFEDWFDSLDKNDRIMIDSRLKRIRRGLWGDSKYLGGGIYELRFHVGAGHRISYGRDGETVVILLEAGVKKGQSADIDRARRFWQEYAGRARK
jgi:putative addiction module killer protein